MQSQKTSSLTEVSRLEQRRTAIAMRRRLLHCTRCIRAAESTNGIKLPSPSQPEPLSPPNPSIKPTPIRVSLAATSRRKLPARNWKRKSTEEEEASTAIRQKFYLSSQSRRLRELIKKRLTTLPPVPNPSSLL
jgi:hypothetical protein